MRCFAPKAFNSWLPRGESLVATLGIGGLAIVLAMSVAAVGWTLVSQRDANQLRQRAELQSLTAVLVPNYESLLASGELSALRRSVIHVRNVYGLTECRVRLRNGLTIADAEPAKITQKDLPAKWPSGPVDEAVTPSPSDAVAMLCPLMVPGHGSATLEIVAPVRQSGYWRSDLALGVGLVSAAGLAGLLVLYRRARARLLTLGLIREALLALRTGENVRDALAIGGVPQEEALAWNELIAETIKLREQANHEKAGRTLSLRGEGRSHLRQACDALSHGVVMLDQQGIVLYANGAAAAFMQCKKEELIGADCLKLIHNEDLAKSVQSALSGNEKQRRTLEIEQTEGGQGIFRVSVRSMRREDGSTIMLTMEDITQQRVAQASRNSFVAQATHELRAPLTNIRLYLETVLEEGETDAAMRAKCLNLINQESRRLERTVGEMLSVAEIEAGSIRLRRDDVRLDKLFEDLQADYTAQAKEKNIALAFELPPKLPVVNGDRDKLMLVLHNLLNNALKYTPAGGKVTVAVRSDSEQLTVDFQDTGFGIAPAEQQRIFEKFYRAKDPRINGIPGSGLGLALAREVTRLHGGDIVVESEVNVGSVFKVNLPVLKNAA